MAMTAEQLQAHLMQKGGGRPGVAFIPAAPNRERVFNKYVRDRVKSGQLQVDDEGRVVDPAANAQTDQRTLNELIAGRNPAFGGGE